MYKAIDVANWFINQFDKNSGDVVTHLKVQKLIYYAEAWTQLLLNKDLFNEPIEAWDHGTVVRAVYEEFRDCSWQPLVITKDVIEFDPDIEDILNQVMEAYGNLTAKTLENMTHSDKPWIEAREGIAPEARCSNVINKEKIKKYFNEKYGHMING